MDKNEQLKLVLQHCNSFNLKKLKVDTLLLIIHSLLCDYEKIDIKDESKKNILPINSYEIEFINRSVHNLKNYLENNIVVNETFLYIFKNKNQSPLFLKIAKNLEPMRVYYQYLTSLFSNKITKGSFWIPELLAFSLIHYFKKEYQKSFINHPLIEDFPTEKLLNIYNKNNIEIKKHISKSEDINSWKVKTNLDEMYDLSEFMIKKYLEFNYKINEKRVSKVRTKRKK
ncbi:MAG: hypothetical protein C0626_07605 [Arcobacter sp.]|uniref:hypothetical protein n=1 Tax=uncultured Arcobacter sp. TaxID=165434 RepID=UPI000CC315E8|nr:hypothetical protein [uncultured Arcobacter sp.]PLY09922.1 MAG: hypothetical protein C0626_07605 [Arcobacter sp.]